MNLTFKKINILVVEDIIPMQQLIEHLLKMLGVGHVIKAQNGREGYNEYLKNKPDIIITDWQMPDMDGLAMIKKIRRSKESPNRTIPIIMMTGFCALHRISVARDNGATEFLIKPFSANDIAKRLTHITRQPRDFIVVKDFIGPDRRRKRKDDYKGPSHRKKETEKKIKPNDSLQKRVGFGNLDEVLIKKSQKLLDDNDIDFIPIVKVFLLQLDESLRIAKNQKDPTRKSLDDITDSIMQIKANARVFKYNLIGNLADIMLNFLEQLNIVDEYVIEIIDAHQTTLSHLVDSKMKGDGGDIGKSLENELENACKRYLATKMQKSKKQLKQVITKK